jgi:hypothetical protein
VWTVVVVVVLPVFEAGVEDVDVVDDDAVEQSVELFGVDAVAALYLAVEAWSAGLDVDVLDALVEHMPVEHRREFGAVVGLDGLDREGQLGEHVVEELDRGLLVDLRVDLMICSRVQSSMAVNW